MYDVQNEANASHHLSSFHSHLQNLDQTQSNQIRPNQNKSTDNELDGFDDNTFIQSRK